jgi:hypothetical protein
MYDEQQQRARMLMRCLGLDVSDVAKASDKELTSLGVSDDTIRCWREDAKVAYSWTFTDAAEWGGI